MNREELKQILPHREPMLLIDEAELREDNLAVGKYTVKGDEWFLQGHFPGMPVVPGVIQCEMMGQTCCVLVSEMVKGKKTLFTGMDKVRFKQQVTPGDTLTFECSMTEMCIRDSRSGYPGKQFCSCRNFRADYSAF